MVCDIELYVVVIVNNSSFLILVDLKCCRMVATA